jgi:prophage antirepressor-like protein
LNNKPTDAAMPEPDAQNQIVVYQPNETVRLDVRLENETVWLTQEQIANLFGTKRPAITKHLSNIYKSGELEREGTCSILEHMGNDGKQSYRTMFYNLDAILSVGYRVNSRNATLFRRWATQVLKTYLLKGYAVNARLSQLEDRVDRRLAKHDDRLATLEQKVDFFVQTKEPPLQSIFYQNKFWDAKSLLIKFIRRAKKELIVIDAYPGVANGECCQCVNVASGQFQFPIEEAA